MGNKNKSPYISYYGKRYAFDMAKLIEVCIVSNKQNSKEKEITNGYTLEDGQDMLTLTSKIEREIRTEGNPQNDVIIFDFVKGLITTLLETQIFEDEDLGGDKLIIPFGTTIALNTLIRLGILIEL